MIPDTQQIKKHFKRNLSEFVRSLVSYVQADDSQWAIKGFIDVYRNVYTISADTKVVSKILEITCSPTYSISLSKAGTTLS